MLKLEFIIVSHEVLMEEISAAGSGVYNMEQEGVTNDHSVQSTIWSDCFSRDMALKVTCLEPRICVSDIDPIVLCYATFPTHT